MIEQPELNMPIEEAKEWLRGHLNLIKEGGIWAIPRSTAIYQVLHQEKTLYRIMGTDESSEEVARALGWRVTGEP